MSRLRPLLALCFALGFVLPLWASATGLAQTAAGQAALAASQSGNRGASTIGESYALGIADVVRSAGSANLMSSEAAINYEQARALNFENRLRYTKGFFENRLLNQEYRQEMRGQRPSTEQLFRLARERAPEPLSATEYDPYSGDLRWPTVLLAADYVNDRAIVEDLVRKRSIDPVGMTAADQAALRASLDVLAERLRLNISVYDPNDYVAAKNYLQSLAVTAGVGLID